MRHRRRHNDHLDGAGAYRCSLPTSGRAQWLLCSLVLSSNVHASQEGQEHLGNFYMVSQHGLKGTSRPSHYHILENDGKMSLDDIERLTFDLCFLYARATKVVSRPAPVYYAHRAAFLAQYYEESYKEVTDQWET